MIELVVLAIAVITIAAFARARGGSGAAYASGVAAVAGYFLLFYGLQLVIEPSGENSNLDVLKFLLPWGRVAAVLLFARFGLGRKRAKPGEHWACPRCGGLNREFAVVCETCDEPYVEPPGDKPADGLS